MQRRRLPAKPGRTSAFADRIAAFIGNPYFIVLHAVWFLLWIAANTGLVTFSPMFDAYPFGLLGIILSIEAIFITGFLLISQNRQSGFAEKRSELDYEVNVRTFREIQRMKTPWPTFSPECRELRKL
jgi:uncharacterized membrane protein